MDELGETGEDPETNGEETKKWREDHRRCLISPFAQDPQESVILASPLLLSVHDEHALSLLVFLYSNEAICLASFGLAFGLDLLV